MALEDIAKVTGGAVLVGAGATAVAFVAATGGALMGGLAGQICDIIPYVNHAIPEGIAYVGNCFTEGDTAKEATQYLQGNIDKLGAAAGFVGGYFKSTLSTKKD